ncbi:MAG TPA: alkaline phosphatase, partial [Chitinophagaceae bacterium]|nr:alkaline phosphatase [Chitinophagaceae bacterium]
DGDGDYDQLYSFGARSFSIWNGNTGKQVYDSGNEIDMITASKGAYPDNRSDDKGSEPEGIVAGRVGNNNLLFVGTERSNGVLVYDVTNPVKPRFLQWLTAGQGPEGLHFVAAENSPTGKSMLVVSNEVDGVVKIFSTN